MASVAEIVAALTPIMQQQLDAAIQSTKQSVQSLQEKQEKTDAAVTTLTSELAAMKTLMKQVLTITPPPGPYKASLLHPTPLPGHAATPHVPSTLRQLPATCPIVESPPPSGMTTPASHYTHTAAATIGFDLPPSEAIERNRRKGCLVMWVPKTLGDLSTQPHVLRTRLNDGLKATNSPTLRDDAILKIINTRDGRHKINTLYRVRFARTEDMENLVANRKQLKRAVDVLLKPDLTLTQEGTRQAYQRIIDANKDKRFYTYWRLTKHPTFFVDGKYHTVSTLVEAEDLLSNAPLFHTRKRRAAASAGDDDSDDDDGKAPTPTPEHHTTTVTDGMDQSEDGTGNEPPPTTGPMPPAGSGQLAATTAAATAPATTAAATTASAATTAATAATTPETPTYTPSSSEVSMTVDPTSTTQSPVPQP